MLDTNIFYESQLNNPAVTWELRAPKWVTVGETVAEPSGTPDTYYSVVVLRGIITETEFGISGGHDFSPSDTGKLGELVNWLGDKYNKASQVGTMYKGGFQDIVNRHPEIRNALNVADSFMEAGSNFIGAGGVYDAAKSLATGATNIVGSRFITSLDKVGIYKGTDIQINFPPIETRIYSKTFSQEPNQKDKNNSEVMTMKNLQTELTNRFIGPLLKTGLSDLDSVIGAQAPPNGYVPSFATLDKSTMIQGTFMLRYGPYKIPNLLVTNFSIRPSTFKVRKNVNGSDLAVDTNVKSNVIVDEEEPIYIDVQVQLQPCTYISRDLVMQMLNLSSIKPET